MPPTLRDPQDAEDAEAGWPIWKCRRQKHRTHGQR